jgi:hypothetical protein
MTLWKAAARHFAWLTEGVSGGHGWPIPAKSLRSDDRGVARVSRVMTIHPGAFA